jgi:hypothetical protein
VINPQHPTEPTTEATWDLSEDPFPAPYPEEPHPLWVEAHHVGNSYPSGCLGLSYLHTINGSPVDLDGVKFNPVEVKLFMEGVTEEKEEFPGNFILYNKDDDDDDGVIDYDDGFNDDDEDGNEDDENTLEDDLVKILLLDVEPSLYLTGTMTFDVTSGGSKVKVWKSQTKGEDNEISLPETCDTPHESGEQVPKFYVEGIDESGGPRDVEFTLSYTVGGKTFEDVIKATVVHVELFRDSAYTQPLDDWPKQPGEDDILRSPKYIFGEDDPIYVQVKNIGTNSNEAEYNVVAVTTASSLIYVDLKETGPDTQIFRNSESELGEFLYLSTEDDDDDFFLQIFTPEDKIKVMNEEVLYFWLRIPPTGGGYKRSVDVMVDRAEVAAVDGTPTLDAAKLHDEIISNYYWFSNGLYDEDHDKNLGDDDKCVDLGNNDDLMYIAGHCWSGDNPTRIYAVDNTYGLKSHYSSQNLQVVDIGTWARELDWLVLACCSTCKIDYITKEGPGHEWIDTMDNGGLTHGIMGYRYGAPGGTTPTTDVQLADEFVSALGSSTVKDAWIDTNFAHKWATYMPSARDQRYCCPGQYTISGTKILS